MICIPHNPILLVTPPGTTSKAAEGHAAGAWQEVRVETVGEVMREVLIKKPGALVLDASGAPRGSDAFEFILKVITTVKRRPKRPVVVVLGTADDPEMEPAVRQAGVSVYLPTRVHLARDALRRFLDTTSTRAGPARVHGPPASGVPPR